MRAAKPAVELVESGRSRGRMFGMVGDEGPDGLGEERVEDEDARQLNVNGRSVVVLPDIGIFPSLCF